MWELLLDCGIKNDFFRYRCFVRVDCICGLPQPVLSPGPQPRRIMGGNWHTIVTCCWRLFIIHDSSVYYVASDGFPTKQENSKKQHITPIRLEMTSLLSAGSRRVDFHLAECSKEAMAMARRGYQFEATSRDTHIDHASS